MLSYSPIARLGEAARAKQDAANGTTDKVAGSFQVPVAGQHIVNEGLRRSIADAYSSFIGVCDQIPDDAFGLALYALDRAYGEPGHTPTGARAFQLTTSPFATSKSKHAAIHNTARHIMKTLDQYVAQVHPYCPPPLKMLARPEDVARAACEGPAPGLQPPHAPGQPGRAHKPRPRAKSSHRPAHGAESGAAWGQQRPASAGGHPGHMAGHRVGGPSYPGRQPLHPPGQQPQLPHNQQQPQQYNPYTAQGPAVGRPATSPTPSPPRVRGGLLDGEHAQRVLAEPAMRPARLGGKRAAIRPVVPGGPYMQGGRAASPTPAGAVNPQAQPQDPTAMAVAAVSAAAAARAAEKAHRQDVDERLDKRSAHTLALGGAAPTDAPVAAAAATRDSRAQSPSLSPPRTPDPMAARMAQARARLPPMRRTPPHLRVSDFYDHVRPAASLAQLHAHMAAHGAAGQGAAAPAGLAMNAAVSHSHSVADAQQLPAGVGAQLQRVRTGSPLLAENYPHRQPGAGHYTAATPLPSARAAFSTPDPVTGLMPGESVSSALGFTVGDEQLLRLIQMYRGWCEAAAARNQAGSNGGSSAAGYVSHSGDQAQGCDGRSGVCSPNRSRRLHPTDAELAYSRMYSMPLLPSDVASLPGGQLPAGPSRAASPIVRPVTPPQGAPLAVPAAGPSSANAAVAGGTAVHAHGSVQAPPPVASSVPSDPGHTVTSVYPSGSSGAAAAAAAMGPVMQQTHGSGLAAGQVPQEQAAMQHTRGSGLPAGAALPNRSRRVI